MCTTFIFRWDVVKRTMYHCQRQTQDLDFVCTEMSGHLSLICCLMGNHSCQQEMYGLDQTWHTIGRNTHHKLYVIVAVDIHSFSAVTWQSADDRTLKHLTQLIVYSNKGGKVVCVCVRRGGGRLLKSYVVCTYCARFIHAGRINASPLLYSKINVFSSLFLYCNVWITTHPYIWPR